MSSWAQGYVADQAYTANFYPFTAPAHLAFCAILAGQHPGAATRPGRVLELGMGMGFGLALTAAACPDTLFEGIDFNPEHVAHARELADEAGLANLSVAEESFEAHALRADEGQHDVDIVVMHGILSWVGPAAQAALVEIVRKRLRPGGLMLVSYNALPGWSALAQVQRLILAHAGGLTGSSGEKVAAGIAFVQDMIAGQSRFFQVHPGLAKFVESLARQDPVYLAHEYLNTNSAPLHVADVAGLFAPAKLSLVGSAQPIENLDVYTVPDALRGAMARERDPLRRETLRDFACNKTFRRDIFVRGTRRLTAAEQAARLGATRFGLVMPAPMPIRFQTPLGLSEAQAEVAAPILAVLADGPQSLADLGTLPHLAGKPGAAASAMSILVSAGPVAAIGPGDSADPSPAQRFNRRIAARVQVNRGYRSLAAPTAGSGVPVTPVELLALSHLRDWRAPDGDALAEKTAASASRFGLALTASSPEGGRPATDPAERLIIVRRQVDVLVNTKLPLWRHLGVL